MLCRTTDSIIIDRSVADNTAYTHTTKASSHGWNEVSGEDSVFSQQEKQSLYDDTLSWSERCKLCSADQSFYTIIITVAFLSGCMDLSRLAVNYYFKDDLHFTPAQLSWTLGLIGVPWMIKPLYGFITDTFPIWGYRRWYVHKSTVLTVLGYSC